MATIIEGNKDDYLCTFSLPETDWIKELAKGMGITREAVLGAAINKGLAYYIETFGKSKDVDKMKDLMQDEIDKPTSDVKDHKTYNKGSCQG